MPGADQRSDLSGLTTRDLARRILLRHKSTVRVKKEHVATENLAVIIEATLKLANRSGFHSMSLRDLSRETGLSMGALYAYFDGKDTLLSMILDTVAGVVEEVLGRPPERYSDDPLARLRWLLATHIHLTEAMLPWFVFVYMEAKAFPPKARAMAVASERRTEAMIAETLEAGRARGLLVCEDAAMTASLIKPMIQDWYVKRGKYRRRGVTAELYAANLIGFVERAIGLDAESSRRAPRAALKGAA
ncbi:MAG: TetR family transcriptional regulator [Rhizobiales bacterium 65-9]|nr:TetR family transcriptional regulator [Hyphomicrobiales bacterium]OJY37235.1 MAG: TetR family transcriptional regulator [Rhizobiales bacterium 65-9]